MVRNVRIIVLLGAGLFTMACIMSANKPDGKEAPTRGRVLGIGGIFFKAEHPRELTEWYERHLGFHHDPRIGVKFPWKTDEGAKGTYSTTWALFPKNTRYFEPSKSALMINYVVDDLDAILARLAAEGVKIDPKRETNEAGRFAWIYDGEGNKVELWQPR